MGKKILLADDSITIQKVIELTFSDEDFEVVTVGNGRLAIEKVQEVRPDIVLCDVIMPEKNGYEVCDFIKKSPQFAATPVLLLTGAFEPFDQELAARVGCDGYLAKPFEPETLIAKVKELLSKAAARQAAPVPPAPVALPSPASVAAPAPFVASTAPAAFAPLAPPPAPFMAALTVSATVAPPPVGEDPEVAFIPDEPFEDLDSPSFDSPGVPVPASANFYSSGPDPVDELLPMTIEESESLSGGDASATVMFRAGSLPWSASTPPTAPPMPGPPEQPDLEPDLPPFEEIIEETEIFPVVMTPPSVVVVVAPPPAPAPLPVVAPVLAAPVFAPTPEPKPAPAPPAPVEASSFADVSAAIQEPEVPSPPSVAAQIDVPVDMVAQIAQRVVAQVSEKVIERIAWEVIPDLAEALIKREIERLKAEIQQLT